jgi:CMP-N,N'-diacetyllegionaminic acid synthase
MITFMVPARGGSQRLPNKNIKLLNGKPLFFHTIDALIGHELIDRVVFTSDSKEYCELAEKQYADNITILNRPKETATNKTKVVEELKRIFDIHPDLFSTEWFGLALPTAPLRSHDTVSNALTFFEKTKNPLFSCNIYDFPTQFAFRLDNSKFLEQNWRPVLEDSPMITGNTRSQDIEKLYRPNGAIYINKISNFLQSKTLYNQANGFEISSIEAMDIDTELDFKIVESLMKESL